jgi:outer membrane protein OmpA-like peptidoglycan-associated protein
VVAALSLVMSGCGILGGSDEPDGGAGGRAGDGQSKSLVKEGWFGFKGDLRLRLEIQGVERYADKSVLRFFVTNLGKEADTPSFGVAGVLGMENLHFTLVDTAGRKAYRPMYTTDQTTVGSQASQSDPGVRYEAVLYFPPLPAGTDTVTVISPGTAGEFTSVPVTEGKGRPVPAAPTPTSGETPAPGSTRAWPMVDVSEGQDRGRVDALFDITENQTQSKTTSGTEETIGLRTDVLFAFDSAQLSAQAKSVLDNVAAETRQKADPAKPPILIEGHTDGKGTTEYNVPLSQQRAAAVQRELASRLGTGYQYKAEGKGETEPIAKEGGTDDEQARQKNRRVEISYQIKQQTPGTSGPGATATRESTGSGTAGRPAPFRAQDGQTVASATRTFDFNSFRLRIDVKPFYRDGPYLVAVFEITNLGPGSQSWIRGDYSGDNGGAFGAFSVVAPATKMIYRGVRIGPHDPQDYEDDWVDPGRAVFREDVNTTNRGFFYVPAPPPNVTSVTFNAGKYGQIPNVPIK